MSKDIKRALEDVTQKLAAYPKRLTHVIGVYETSVALAHIYHVDEEDMAIASLFHDYFKYDTLDYQRMWTGDDVFKRYQEFPMNLHGYAAASYVEKHYPNVSRQALDAMRHHVFGKENMTLEEKILYVADCCEPNRTHLDTKKMFELACKDLDKAVLECLNLTIKHLIQDHQIVHEEQMNAYKYYQRSAQSMDFKPIIDILEKVNAKDIGVYDFEKTSPFYDYFIIATTNERQANAAISYFKKELGSSVKQVEGKGGSWILIDCSDVIIHLFTEEARNYYQFETRLLNIKRVL